MGLTTTNFNWKVSPLKNVVAFNDNVNGMNLSTIFIAIDIGIITTIIKSFGWKTSIRRKKLSFIYFISS